MKQKNPQIECVDDLLVALAEVEGSANEKIAGISADTFLCVERHGAVVAMYGGEDLRSVPASDSNAKSAFATLSKAINDKARSILASSGDELADFIEETVSSERPERRFDRSEGRPAFKRSGFKKPFKKNKADEEIGIITLRDAMLRSINTANERGGKLNMDVLFNVKFLDGHVVLTEGDELLLDQAVHCDVDSLLTKEVFYGPLSKLRSRLWIEFDARKPDDGKGHMSGRRNDRREIRPVQNVSERSEVKPVEAPKPQKRSFDDLLAEAVKKANEELAKYSQDLLTVTTDSVAVYVSAGKIPVVSQPRVSEDYEAAVKAMSEKMSSFVNSAHGAFDRRQKNTERVSQMECDTAFDRAMVERFNSLSKPEEPKAEELKPEEPKAEEPKPEEPEAEVSDEDFGFGDEDGGSLFTIGDVLGSAANKAEKPKPEEPKAVEPEVENEDGDWKYGPNPDVAKEIVSSVKNQVKRFNSSLGIKFFSVSKFLGDESIKMSFRGFSRGVVVSFGGEPCYITMFPLVNNNKAVKDTITYIETALKELGEKRMEYLVSVRNEIDRSNRLRELASKRDEIEAQKAELEKELKAMAM